MTNIMITLICIVVVSVVYLALPRIIVVVRKKNSSTTLYNQLAQSNEYDLLIEHLIEHLIEQCGTQVDNLMTQYNPAVGNSESVNDEKYGLYEAHCEGHDIAWNGLLRRQQ